jgi:Fur family transcriptional regulator, ferric uptake regulator
MPLRKQESVRAPEARPTQGASGIDTPSDTRSTSHTAQNLGKLREKLERYMNDHGLRSTDQRRLIVEELFNNAPDHVTIDRMLDIVKRLDQRIGYATVYRTMRMLSEAGVLHEYKFSDGMTRYELVDSAGHHDHFICLDCGVIQEFEEPLIEELQSRIASKLGFKLRHHKHELYGNCTRVDCPYRAEREGTGAGVEEPRSSQSAPHHEH